MKRKMIPTAVGLLGLVLTIPMLGFIHSPSDFSEVSVKSSENSTALSSVETDQSENLSTDFVTVTDPQTGEVCSISIEEYLIGVVSAEMPASFETEALKAQAVAAHTYALERYSTTTTFSGAQIPTDPSVFQAYCSTATMQQKYGDSFEEKYQKIKEAVDSVLNEIITYQNEPIVAAFHSMSGGITQSSESVWGGSLPYLVPVDSHEDTVQSNYIAETFVDLDTVQSTLLSAYPDLQLPERQTDWFIISSHTASDYVDTVQVGNYTLSGSQVRSLFNLNSSDFTVTYQENGFLFTTKGKGHGVGMSQYGANEMAKDGKSYQEILDHYYPGTELTEL